MLPPGFNVNDQQVSLSYQAAVWKEVALVPLPVAEMRIYGVGPRLGTPRSLIGWGQKKSSISLGFVSQHMRCSLRTQAAQPQHPPPPKSKWMHFSPLPPPTFLSALFVSSLCCPSYILQSSDWTNPERSIHPSDCPAPARIYCTREGSEPSEKAPPVLLPLLICFFLKDLCSILKTSTWGDGGLPSAV